MDLLRDSNQKIARDSSESRYSWDSNRSRKTETFNNGNSVE